jgi:hypothetical protein
MDVCCPKCGEPWDHDCLHDEAGERYGVPYFLTPEDKRAYKRNPAYDSDAYQVVYRQVSSEFRAEGCAVLKSYGAKCAEPSAETDRTFGLTRQQAAGALYDMLGDDMDGAAAMLEDMGF